MPGNAWAVSASGNGKVMAWFKPNGSLYDLYIGGDGGVWADQSCEDIFSHYINAERFAFENSFHTDKVENMYYMFFCCKSLKELNLSTLNTANVTTMDSMFRDCEALSKLNMDNCDTSRVKDMDEMFHGCHSLKELDLSSFDTSNVRDMGFMFNQCAALSNLELSKYFITVNTEDTFAMFSNCPAGDKWGHLEH